MFPAGHKHLARKTTARKPTEPTADIDQWEGKKKETNKTCGVQNDKQPPPMAWQAV
jgi:hypothetical protein